MAALAQRHSRNKRRTIEADTNAGVEWIKHLDEAVAEVFESMLDRDCAAVQNDWAISPDIAARIRLSGSLEAQCLVEFPSSSAEKLTDALLGSGVPSADFKAGWDDTMMGDAVGELCNMIAGGLKRRLGAPALGSDLSVPTIFTGRFRVPEGDIRYRARVRMLRIYAFDGSPFLISLMIL